MNILNKIKNVASDTYDLLSDMFLTADNDTTTHKAPQKENEILNFAHCSCDEYCKSPTSFDEMHNADLIMDKSELQELTTACNCVCKNMQGGCEGCAHVVKHAGRVSISQKAVDFVRA